MVKMIIMKKYIKTCFILIVAIVVSSCSFSGDEDYVYPPKKLAEDVVLCFLEQETETLKSLFSSYIKSKYDMDLQIEEAFAFIDDEILSYDEPFGDESGSSVKNGEWIESKFYGKISNIKTDTGKSYEIIINSFDINKDNPDKVGCSRILIISTTFTDDTGETDKYIIGE